MRIDMFGLVWLGLNIVGTIYIILLSVIMKADD